MTIVQSKKIAQEKEKNAQTDGFFVMALNQVISGLPERAQEILRERFGVGGKAHTLESIGGTYHITRERVRQIIREALKKIRARENSTLNQVAEKITLALGEHNGIMKEELLIEILSKNNVNEKGALRFFLSCIQGITSLNETDDVEASVTLLGFDISELKLVVEKVRVVLETAGDALPIKSCIEGAQIGLDQQKMVENFLSVSRVVKKNRFNKWGIAVWSEISPKGAREKAFAVLKEVKKPLHFRDIAKMIDEYYPGRKNTHPQTVHNELIKDNRFVLVGRGIYALESWGYSRGTVKDVLESILIKHKQPMNRTEIIDEILKMRQVKRTTIMINLNNYFSKVGKDLYTIKK